MMDERVAPLNEVLNVPVLALTSSQHTPWCMWLSRLIAGATTQLDLASCLARTTVCSKRDDAMTHPSCVRGVR